MGARRQHAGGVLGEGRAVDLLHGGPVRAWGERRGWGGGVEGEAYQPCGGGPYTFEGYWPVVAEQHGVVFVRLNLAKDAVVEWAGYQGQWGGGVYPSTNGETRTLLEANNGALENLFALDLKDGSQKFVPAVGFGGVEYSVQCGRSGLRMAPMPVVKVMGTGVRWRISRFGAGRGARRTGAGITTWGKWCWTARRWQDWGQGTYALSIFRIRYVHITDEQTPITMAGNTLLHAHWGASESERIVDRTGGKGLSHTDPITVQVHPVVIRRSRPVRTITRRRIGRAAG